MRRQFIMAGQQLSRNRRTILAWTVIWTLISLLFATVFKTLSQTAGQSSRIFQALPPAVLQTVNISADYLTKPENFLSGQFLTVYLLAGSIFASLLGVNAIGGKLADKTLFHLLSKGLSRQAVFLLQAGVLGLTIVVLNLLVALVVLTSFHFLSGANLSGYYIVSAFCGASAIFATFAALGLALGVVLEKPRAIVLGSAVAIISFFANGLGSLQGAPAWIQRLSLYYYLDIPHLRTYYSLTGRISLCAFAVTLLLYGGVRIFRRKDLYL